MKTPAFWQKRGWLSHLLLPFSFLYEQLSTLSQLGKKPVTMGVPVICIGNLTAGGSGKTPVALHIGAMLRTKHVNAYYLSRGYGGALAGPVVVDPALHSARDVGDEPLLLAKMLPTIVSHDRIAGAMLAKQMGAQAIIMDDGFQNQQLLKTLSILVVDGTIGFGNGRLLPAGPLRESVASGFRRAQMVVVINPIDTTPSFPLGPVVIEAHSLPQLSHLRGQRLVAFCGLAYPDKFFSSLKVQGLTVVNARAFADHHPYSQSELDALFALAEKENAQLITTDKDAVRITADIRAKLHIATVALKLDKEYLLEQLLHYCIGQS